MKRAAFVIVPVLLVLLAAPVAAQGGFSIGPSAGILMLTGDSDNLTFLRFGGSARFSLGPVALRADVRYMMLEDTSWLDGAAGLEIPILLGIYGRAAGGYMLAFSGKDKFPYLEAGLGFGLAGFFVEAVYSLLIVEGTVGCIGATAGYRFRL